MKSLATLLIAALLAVPALAQDAAPAKDAAAPARQDAKPAEKKTDPAVEKWLGVLAQHAAHQNEKVSGSAFRGLVAGTVLVLGG